MTKLVTSFPNYLLNSTSIKLNLKKSFKLLKRCIDLVHPILGTQLCVNKSVDSLRRLHIYC